jgi:nucleoside-diphosphate-sugar epimerase
MFEGKKVLITGAAGFIGSHLVDRLLVEGANVTGIDNLITGNKDNLTGALKNPTFNLIEAEVVEWTKQIQNLEIQFDFLYHLASPASPIAYQHNPVATYMVNSVGTHNLLEMAIQIKAKFLFTSTSEIYGDPMEHPQKETYFGNVNPIGPRACYDESKRFGEMVTKTFIERYQANARIVRIFNTYGPRMQVDDGRVMPALISQAIRNQPMTIEGSGEQTRSFCEVTDLVEYLVRAMSFDEARGEVINIGNPEEHTINELACLIKQLSGSESEIIHIPGRPEDIRKRCPDISKAIKLLGIAPKINLESGLKKMIQVFGESSTH